MKKLIVSLAAFIVFALPTSAYADTITWYAPATGADTNNSNPGGTQQVDLDHHRAYAWRIDNVSSRIPAGHSITGAKLTFKSITNWDTNPNTLFVHLLDSAKAAGITSFVDASGVPVPVSQIQDNFANGLYASNPLVDPGTGNTLLGSFSDTNGVSTLQDVVFTFNQAQLTKLMEYLANGNNLAFGLDPDCHFWNNGIKFEITTSPNAVPEPATMALLGTGLAGLYYRRRRQREQEQS